PALTEDGQTQWSRGQPRDPEGSIRLHMRLARTGRASYTQPGVLALTDQQSGHGPQLTVGEHLQNQTQAFQVETKVAENETVAGTQDPWRRTLLEGEWCQVGMVVAPVESTQSGSTSAAAPLRFGVVLSHQGSSRRRRSLRRRRRRRFAAVRGHGGSSLGVTS